MESNLYQPEPDLLAQLLDEEHWPDQVLEDALEMERLIGRLDD